MVDLNSLPDTTIRHDPWQHANMRGAAVHCGYSFKGATGPSFYLENTGDEPVVAAFSTWCSVACRTTMFIKCTFTGTTIAEQYLINRAAQAARGIAMDSSVGGPLIPYIATTEAPSTTEAMIWEGGANERIEIFGPGSLTGQFLIIDPSEKVAFTLSRSDGETDSQYFNMNLTWLGYDPNELDWTGAA